MSRITLAQLEALQCVCRLGTFQAAAEHLNVTQPTISLRIRALEDALGQRLFDRRGKAAKLSAAGRLALQYAEQGLDLFEEMTQRMRTGDPLQGSLRVGSSNVFAMTCLPEIIAVLERKYPRLKIELTAANSVQLMDMLHSNQLDIAFLSQPEQRSRIALAPLGESDIAWVGAAARPLKRSTVRPQDLLGQNIVTQSSPSLLERIITDWFAEENMPTPPLSYCNNAAIIANLVAGGVAISALPVCVLHDEIASGKVIRYDQKPAFKALQVTAAYQASAKGAGMDAVLRLARSVVERSAMFRSP